MDFQQILDILLGKKSANHTNYHNKAIQCQQFLKNSGGGGGGDFGWEGDIYMCIYIYICIYTGADLRFGDGGGGRILLRKTVRSTT